MFCLVFFSFYICHPALLFHKANPLNWTQNLPTRSWRCHTTTWQWSEMRPHPRRATARSASAARAATAWSETSTLTAVDTTGRLWLEGAHGEGFFFLGLRNVIIWNKPLCCYSGYTGRALTSLIVLERPPHSLYLMRRCLHMPCDPQVRCGHRLQILPQARVDRQKLGLLGSVPLQQLLGCAPQQQGVRHRALAAPAARRGPAGLWRRLRDLLRCSGVPAPAHVPRVLRPARVPRVQCVEQVSDHPHWPSYPRSPRRTGPPRLERTDNQGKPAGPSHLKAAFGKL